MVQAFLIKYAEIGIKGKNRYIFENALRDRVSERLMRCEGQFRVEKEQGAFMYRQSHHLIMMR